MIVECAVTSCTVKLEANNEKAATDAGWKNLVDSSMPPAGHSERTHIGWCPTCAKKFNVE